MRERSVEAIFGNEPMRGRKTKGMLRFAIVLLWLGGIGLCLPAQAAEIDDARKAFRQGDYATAEKIAGGAVAAGTWNEQWPRLLVEIQLTRGRYSEAVATYESALERFPSSLPLRMLGVEAYRYSGQGEKGESERAQIFELLRRSPARYSTSESLVAAGRYFLQRGEDGRKILELFFDRVRAGDPKYVDAYLATAELALAKHDDQVAADALAEAARLDPADPQIAYLASQAWYSSNSKRAASELQRALDLNPQHVPSLLFQVDQCIDREQYSQAEDLLRLVENVNPSHPLLWAYRSVLAHLRGDHEEERRARDEGLRPWPQNPAVDHWIGRKLSQKYRFSEGAQAQRRALQFDPRHSEARFQLAQDLLRLGEDDVGWELAHAVHRDDAYNVVAYNLVTLHDHLRTFRTLRRGNILLRMESREAEIYGAAVLDLLDEAQQTLGAKYAIVPDGPVVVEIFPRQQDFAIRTFGLPGGDGFLGVCFGRVITANSPASQGPDPANWKAVLWHEYCHVLTLSKTNNRMPRWLSEGLSVYEERQRDPTWGQRMTPIYRQMILGEDLVPISQLSAPFLSPKSPVHLQLAYFQAALAVEYLIETHGMEAMNRLLVDLGAGLPIDAAIERTIGTLDKIDEDFLRFARGKARVFGERFDWSNDALPEGAQTPATWDQWLESRPNNFWGLRGKAAAQRAAEDFAGAKETLEKLLDLFPKESPDPETLEQLAFVHGRLQQVEEQRQVLRTLLQTQSAGFASTLRLIELDRAARDWHALVRSATRALEINPLVPAPHEALVEAHEQLHQEAQSASSLRALAVMDPVDPAALFLRTANAFAAAGDRISAKRHVLLALEQAPRYRQAQELLLKLYEEEPPSLEGEAPATENHEQNIDQGAPR